MVEVDVNAVVALTRRLVDIESITGNEGPVGNFLCDELLRRGFQSAKIPVEGERCNVFAVFRGIPACDCVLHPHGHGPAIYSFLGGC